MGCGLSCAVPRAVPAVKMEQPAPLWYCLALPRVAFGLRIALHMYNVHVYRVLVSIRLLFVREAKETRDAFGFVIFHK